MEEVESLKVGVALADAWERIGAEDERLPVLNREPRTMPENNRALWGALMKRDGGKCWMCGTTAGMLVIDHLKPRSAFPPAQIEIADRSDNLAIACWDCNTDKSNRAVPYRKPLGIIWYCPMDWRAGGVDECDAEEWLEHYSSEDQRVYCHSHGCAVTVPADWQLAGLS